MNLASCPHEHDVVAMWSPVTLASNPSACELAASRGGRSAEAGVGEATLQVWMPRKGHRSK
eukprot:COSAG02_NODE_14846_length_1230_cov_1.108753_3_plen_60_part_01